MIRRFRKRAKYKNIHSVNQIKAHLREFIFDSQIADVEDISRRLGFSPLSQELMEKEEQESESRVQRISHLIPLLFGYSTLFAEVFMAPAAIPEHLLRDEESRRVVEQAKRKVRKDLEDSMSHLLVGAVSQMVDLGLLDIPKGKK